MPIFTIETTYRLRVYRSRTYEADTIQQAWRLAIEDSDRSDGKLDCQSASGAYVSGIWQSAEAPDRGAALPLPSPFVDAVQRKADYFETLLGVLKVLAYVPDLKAADLPFWLPRAQAAIAKAEASLAGAPAPD
jgi:hypothetical protein